MAISKSQFRKLIWLQIALLILIFIGAVIDDQYYQYIYPETLHQYWESYMDTPATYSETLFGWFSVIIGIWGMQNLWALYTFRKYAPKHLAILMAIGFIVGLTAPLYPYVILSLWWTFFDLSIFLCGFILALVFFTDLSKEFKI